MYAFIGNMTKICRCKRTCIVAYNLDSETKKHPSFVSQTKLHFLLNQAFEMVFSTSQSQEN